MVLAAVVVTPGVLVKPKCETRKMRWMDRAPSQVSSYQDCKVDNRRSAGITCRLSPTPFKAKLSGPKHPHSTVHGTCNTADV